MAGSAGIEVMKQQFANCMFEPGEPAYERSIMIDNGRIDSSPAVVFAPRSVAAIADIVSVANRYGVRVTVKGGGHGAAGYCLNSDGVVLDLAHLDRVAIEVNAGVAHVQAGARWRNVYAALVEAQTELIAIGGGCVDVGVAGFLLGGGYSFVSRSYGMAIDSVLSLTVITADGSILNLSRDENEPDRRDLFWACLGGGGGNFGVAIEVTLKLHVPKSPEMMMAELRFSNSQASEVLAFVNEWEQSLPDEMALYGIWRGAERISDLGGEEQVFGFTAIYNGGCADGLKLLEPLLSHGPKFMRSVQLPLPKFELLHGRNTVVSGAKCYMRSGVLPANGWSADVISIVERYMQTPPNSNCFLVWTHAGGAIERIPSDATAFPHRQARFVPQIKAMWHRAEEKEAVVGWAQSFFDELSPHFTGAYVNYIDPLLANWRTAYYGDNYSRLLHTKRRWDPKNFFSFPQAVGSDNTVSNTRQFAEGFSHHILSLQG